MRSRTARRQTFISAIPADPATLIWHPLSLLPTLPLTGLARKILSRVDLYSAAGPETPQPLVI